MLIHDKKFLKCNNREQAQQEKCQHYFCFLTFNMAYFLNILTFKRRLKHKNITENLLYPILLRINSLPLF